MIETGTVLQDRFLIEKELARGGMGAVYLATDQKFGSRVAIKERFYEDAQLAEAFAREARILNCLHHPILPHVSDYFNEGDGHFLVMEYIEGEDLSEILKREAKAFSVEDVLHWILELLDGLDYLHSADPPIVHRDIKPGNLKLTSRGNLVLLDFGLAKETSGNAQGVRSVFGYSRRYSPLEQIEGAGTSPRSDIFSLGATAFHLITGEAPVDVLARASAIVAGRPDPLPLASEINPDVDVSTAKVIQQAMSLAPEQRFASAREMSTALHEALDSQAAVTSTPEEKDLVEVWIPDSPALAAVPNSEPGAAAMVNTVGASEVNKDLPAAAPPTAAPSAAVSTRLRTNFTGRPFWYRPALWAAVVIAALFGIGFLGYSVLSPVDVATDTAQESTLESTVPIATAPEVDTEPEVTVAETRPAESDSTPGEPAVENSEGSENARESTYADRGNNPDKTGLPKRNAPSKQDPAKERNGKGSVRPAFPDPRRAATGQDRSTRPRQSRRIPSRRNDDESPVSSIEMIFTGIPPERQRRQNRRQQPY